ncbi:MAG: hypothetical protein H0U35_00710 [Sporichthyaceae bacterium]|nr:hypothetical protein [Sporichthyaceae bacterium]
MLLLGLLLVVLAAAVAVGAMLDAGESATVEILGQTITTTIAGVFVAGAATMLTFLLGVWAISASMGRARRKRAQRKEAKRSQRDSVKHLEEERAALREENERLASQLTETRPVNTPSSTAAGAGVGGAAGATGAGSTDAHDHRSTPGHDHDHDHDESTTGSTSAAETSAPTGSTSGDERVVDHHTDASSETSTGGRHRDLP